MTLDRDQPYPLGDIGHRYEVRYLNAAGEECIFGWIDDPTGGDFVKFINANPYWHSPMVIDRQGGES